MLKTYSQDLSANEGLRSLADNLATLSSNASLLNMAQHIQMTPEIEKAMQQAEKILEGLEIGSDPI
jgi:hypothetical protein